MAEKKVTEMVIKVDLGCEKCRKKIKKILCKIPQIQNQIYDKKANTVTITVVCCSPEKIKKKICCKGGDSIKGIEIKEPEKPKLLPPPPAEKPKEAPKQKEPEKPKEKPKGIIKEPKEPKPDKTVVVVVEPPKSKDPEPPPKAPAPDPKLPEPAPKPPQPAPKASEPAPKPPQPAPKASEPAPKPPAPAPKVPEPKAKPPEPIPAYPPPPVRACCMECYGGHGGGPCWEGYGRPRPCYEGYGMPGPCYEAYGRPVYDSWGGGYGYGYGGCRRGCHVGRCDCLSDENPSSCSVM